MELKSILVITGLGILIGAYFTYVLKKYTFGKIYGAIAIGVIGGFLGHALLSKILDYVDTFFKNELDIKLYPTLIGSILLVWLFYKVSPKSN